MKKCTKCKQEKNYDGFYRDKKAKDGYNCICKACRLKMDRERRKKDPGWVEKRKKQNAEFHRKNREQIRERNKKWLASDKGKEIHRRSIKKFKKLHPEKVKAHAAVYRAVKRGELVRPARCQNCDNLRKVEAHHATYGSNQRTLVNWLCVECHKQKHSKN